MHDFTIMLIIGRKPKMKNKRGFVFVETIVVVAVLTISILMVYSTYSSMLIKEKNRLKYNDSVYLYRTYYVTKFLKNFRFDNLIQSFAKNEDDAYLQKIDCNTGAFIDGENKNLCESILFDLNISNLYLAKSNLSALQDCTDYTNGVCTIFRQINASAVEYVKTIGGQGNGYRIIVEFSENKDGTNCNGEGCQFYYTTLSLGDWT